MPDRLSTLDASFLYLEEPATVMHVGSVAIFEPPADGFDHERLLALVATRIAYVPRYRQRVRTVPGRLANPVWVDDEHFDIAYHVRRVALPRPGAEQQLAELVARLQSRRLDRHRPLWELYLVEGLADGQVAVVSKAHQALVDGVRAVDLTQVILDDNPDPVERPADTWHPASEPTDVELIAGAVVDAVRQPRVALESAWAGAQDIGATAGRLLGQVGTVVRAAARSATNPAPTSPFNVSVGEQRRYVMVATSLQDYRTVRARTAGHQRGELSITAVILAVIAGAVRSWLLTRGEPVAPATVVRALVPVSVSGSFGDNHGGDVGPGDVSGGGVSGGDVSGGDVSGGDVSGGDVSDGNEDGGVDSGLVGGRVAAFTVDLPVGESSPAIRLHRLAYAVRVQAEAGRAVGADTLVGLAGFAPPTLHSLGARVASAASRRLANLTITNVPGPQHPMYAAGARMLASYPVMPLVKGQAVSIGLTSYDGGVCYGINADLDAMPDVDVLGQCLIDALAELKDTSR
ncbi:MAG: WS/DGAT/MGAT family O-acyltransferase [Angustibacter sp.]